MKAARSFFTALSCVLLAWHSESQAVRRDLHPARVWTVDLAGGADFLDLPEAVAAAHSGDVLLVAPTGIFPGSPTYSGFELRGKGLTILGDGGIAALTGSTLVKGLPPSELACLRSLELRRPMALEDAAGTVWIEDCTLPTNQNAVGLRITDCDAVVLMRTSVLPGSVYVGGGAALQAVRSRVHAFQCVFEGASWHQIFGQGTFPPSAGGDGAVLESSFLYAAGSTFRGGQGQSTVQNPFTGNCLPAGPGGIGLNASSASPTPLTLGCTFLGGLGGGPSVPSCLGSAPDGPPIAGTVVQDPLPFRGYELSTPVRAGTSCQLTATGNIGDLVWSVFSATEEPVHLPLLFGTLVGSQPLTVVFEGVIDATRTLTKSVPVPQLGSLKSFERLFAQGLFFDPASHAYLASPSLLVVVD